MKQHVTMIVCDKTAFKWGVTRYPRFFDHLWTCRFLPALVFSDPESVPDVHQIRDCVSAGSARLRMSGLKNPGSSNWNNTLKDALMFEYLQPDIRQIRDCVSAGSLRLRMRGLKSRAHLIQNTRTCIFVITFLASMWAHFCNAFLIRLSDFRHEITLEFAGPVFSRSPLLKATDAIYFRDIRPLCVGATPVPKGFYHMSNF